VSVGNVPRPYLGKLNATAFFSTGLLAGSLALLAMILFATRLQVDWTGLGICLIFSLAVLPLGLALKLVNGSPRIANFSLVTAALIGSTVCSTIAVNAGLRLRFPLADDWLHQADRTLGFDPVALIGFFADHPRLTDALQLVYENSTWIAVLAVILHSVRREAPWVPFACYSGGLLTISAISTLMPAKGNIAHSGLAYLQGHGLPTGAGTYYLPAFSYYRDSASVIINNAHLSGVAVFPSFHTVMGLIIATSLYGTRFAPVATAFGAAVIISAIPIGGHYVVDLFAGCLVWVLWMWLAHIPLRTTGLHRANRPANMPSTADTIATA
jgi:hypothetical protein